MDWKRECAAVIPCFNEAARVASVVAEVKKHLPGVIVVDDGSTDATGENARTAGAEIIHLPKNLGKGMALRHGWLRARELGFNWVLMLDGDGQHAADDVPKFFDCAGQTLATLVVGNRMDDSDAMPVVRRFANRWMSRRISKLTGVELPDSQCGFRLAHLETLLNLPLHTNRFEIESSMLVAFLTAGIKVEFIPVRTIYENCASKINPLTDSWRWLRWRLARRETLAACATMRAP